jgi:hypothetical protein
MNKTQNFLVVLFSGGIAAVFKNRRLKFGPIHQPLNPEPLSL